MDLNTVQKIIILNSLAFSFIVIFILIGAAPNLHGNGFKPETWFVYRDLDPSGFWFSIMFYSIFFILILIVGPLLFAK